MPNRVSPLIVIWFCLLPRLAGADIQVNSFTVGDQSFPAVATDAVGNFVVVWQDNGHDGSGLGVFGQLFDNIGFPSQGFQVNTYTPGGQGLPDVAASTGGAFTVVWDSTQDQDDYGIFARHFASTGLPTSPEFAINSYTRGSQIRPSVTRLDSGSFAVVFEDDRPPAGVASDIRNYVDDPSTSGPDLVDDLVNTTTAGDQLQAKVSSPRDAGPVWTVWRSVGQDGSGDGVFAKQLFAFTPPVEFQVSTITAGDQNEPDVAAVGSTGSAYAVIVWNSLNRDGASNGVFARLYSDSPTPIGAEFQVNTYTVQAQGLPSVAAIPDGRFVVAWASATQDGSGVGIFAQRYQSFANPIGTEFQVNTYTLGDQTRPDVAMDYDGNFVVAWQGAGQDGDGNGIFARRFMPAEAGETKTAVGFGSVLTTHVTTPNPGFVTIEPGGAAPNDLTLVSEPTAVHITAPPATAADPLVVTFVVDGALACTIGELCSPGSLPLYLDRFSHVYRNGVAVPDCTGPPGVASPDPCVQSRVVELDYDIDVTVLTSNASEWLVTLPNGHCPAVVDPGCITGFAKGSLLVKQEDVGKQKVIAKFIGGPALAQTDLGNPLAPVQGGNGTVETLCVYDGMGNLAGDLHVARAGDLCGSNSCWSPIGNAPNNPAGPGIGYKFKDSLADSFGVKSINYRGGDAGKSKAVVKAAGTNVPPGIASALMGSMQATVQLRAVDGQCLSVTVADVKINDGVTFKAKL